MEKIIEERLSDKFFRRYTSRAFFIVMAASVFLWFGKVNGQEWAFVACVFVLMNLGAASARWLYRHAERARRRARAPERQGGGATPALARLVFAGVPGLRLRPHRHLSTVARVLASHVRERP